MEIKYTKADRSDGKGGHIHKYDYPAVFRIDRIKDYKETGEKFHVSYADQFEEGEFRKRLQNQERIAKCFSNSLSTAINIYLKKLGREKRIPFEVAVDPFYSQENMTRLKESVAQMEATGGTVYEVDFDD